MDITELMDVCESVLTNDLAKVDEMAGRTRGAAFEHWFQCELIPALLKRFPDAYRDLITDWYYPKHVVHSPKGPAQPDILLVSRTLSGSLPDILGQHKQSLTEGCYIELKTSIHNDVSPPPKRAQILGKLSRDYERILQVTRAAKKDAMPVDAFSIGLIIDSTPLWVGSRKPCIETIANWINNHDQLCNGLCRNISFADDYGVALWAWDASLPDLSL
jgi:hypothetical protein